MTKITGPVTIGYNFHPEVLLLNTNTHLENIGVVETWREVYHAQVDTIFDKIRQDYNL